MRLNRFLSACGLGSRRGSEELIRDGRVVVNGKVCTDLATQVEDKDDVVVDGTRAKAHKGMVIAFHKPRGFVCSRRDEYDRETIYTLLPDSFQTLHHVGRLDKESEGLLLMTNRGEVSQRLAHPSQGVEKEYEVLLESRFDPVHLSRLTDGFHTEEGLAKAERAWIIGDFKLGMVLKQGLKRQIRLMLYFLGYEVKRLVRVRIGNLTIKGLPEGGWKELSDRDVEKLLLNPLTKDRPKLSKPYTPKPSRKRSGKKVPEIEERVPSKREVLSKREKPLSKRDTGSRGTASKAAAARRKKLDGPARRPTSDDGPTRRPTSDAPARRPTRNSVPPRKGSGRKKF